MPGRIVPGGVRTTLRVGNEVNERDVTGWMHKGETVPNLVAGLGCAAVETLWHEGRYALIVLADEAQVRAASDEQRIEGVSLRFDENAIERLADIAEQVNERQENIGARRLQTVMERVLDEHALQDHAQVVGLLAEVPNIAEAARLLSAG